MVKMAKGDVTLLLFPSPFNTWLFPVKLEDEFFTLKQSVVLSMATARGNSQSTLLQHQHLPSIPAIELPVALPGDPTAHPHGVTGLLNLYFLLTHISILLCCRTGWSTVHTQGFKNIPSPGSDGGQPHRSSPNTSPSACQSQDSRREAHRSGWAGAAFLTGDSLSPH